MDVRQMRLRAGLTQRQLATRTGIAQPNISAYESGRLTPSQATVERIAAATRPRPSVLLEEHPEVSWRQMKGMRNVVAHESGFIDHRIMWTTLSGDLPDDAAAVARILADG